MTMTGASARTGPKDTLARVLDGRQMLVSTSPRRARRIAALGVVAGFGSLAAMVARNHEVADWSPSGRLVWSLSLLAAVVLVARGIYLGRPVTSAHAGAALTILAAGIGAHLLGIGVSGDLLVAGAGLALMWPLPSRPGPDGPESVAADRNYSGRSACAVCDAVHEECVFQSRSQRRTRLPHIAGLRSGQWRSGRTAWQVSDAHRGLRDDVSTARLADHGARLRTAPLKPMA
jgi:hypothetical protein